MSQIKGIIQKLDLEKFLHSYDDYLHHSVLTALVRKTNINKVNRIAYNLLTDYITKSKLYQNHLLVVRVN